MLKSVSWVMTAILIGCLAAPANAFAARIDTEPQEFSHSSSVGTASITHDENGFVFTFQSRSGRTIKMVGDRKTSTFTIEGLAIRTTPGHITVSYRGQLVDAVANSDGMISEADAAAMAHLGGIWRDETGIGPDLVLAQIGFRSLQSQLSRHPQALNECRHAEDQLAESAVAFSIGLVLGCVPCDIAAGALVLINLTTAAIECGWGDGYECDSCGAG